MPNSMSFTDLQNNVLKRPQRDRPVSKNDQTRLKFLCWGFLLGGECLLIVHAIVTWGSVRVCFFFNLSMQPYYTFEKYKITPAISSNTHPWISAIVPKALPCVFYLDLRFFVFCWHKQPKIKIGHLDGES